jgi:hypothetical protein
MIFKKKEKPIELNVFICNPRNDNISIATYKVFDRGDHYITLGSENVFLKADEGKFSELSSEGYLKTFSTGDKRDFEKQVVKDLADWKEKNPDKVAEAMEIEY